MTISKKKLKAIGLTSVFIDVMKEYIEPSNLDGKFFFDHAPDSWDKEDRRLFDMAAEIEHRLKEQITAILSRRATEKGR